MPRTVCVVAIDKQNNVYLCKQYRHIFDEDSLEIPRGLVDSGETTKDAAIRELKEETGIEVNDLEYIGSIRTSVGFLDEEAQIFLARHVTPKNNFKDETNEIDKVFKLPLDKVLSLIKENKIIDGLTVSAILKVNQLV